MSSASFRSTAAFAAACIISASACSSDGSGEADLLGPPPPLDVTGQIQSFDYVWRLGRGAQAFQAGDTTSIIVRAAGAGRVRWIGLEGVYPQHWRDSVAIPDSISDDVQVEWKIWFPEWYTGVVRVNGFARDARRTLEEIELPGNPISYYETVPWPRRTATFSGRVTSYALDAARELLYFTLAEQSRIEVLSLATMTLRAPIAIAAPPVAIDLVPGGDSLVAVFRDPSRLTLVPLEQGVATGVVQTITLVMPRETQYPSDVIVASNRKIFVPLDFPGYGFVGALIEVDLATMAQRQRIDVGLSGAIGGGARFARSSDYSRLALVDRVMCCAPALSPYLAAQDAFGAPRSNSDQAYRWLTFDNAGQRAVFGGELLDANLMSIARFHAPGEMGASGISADGRTVYFRSILGAHTSLIRVAADSGVVWDHVPLTGVPDRFLALPTGSRLLTFAINAIDLVDFSGIPPGSGPPAAARAPLNDAAARIESPSAPGRSVTIRRATR